MEELWLNHKNSLILGGGVLFGGLILYKLKPPTEYNLRPFKTVLNRQNSSPGEMEILNTNDDNFRNAYKKMKPNFKNEEEWLNAWQEYRDKWMTGEDSERGEFVINKEDVIGGKKRKYSKKNK